MHMVEGMVGGSSVSLGTGAAPTIPRLTARWLPLLTAATAAGVPVKAPLASDAFRPGLAITAPVGGGGLKEPFEELADESLRLPPLVTGSLGKDGNGTATAAGADWQAVSATEPSTETMWACVPVARS